MQGHVIDAQNTDSRAQTSNLQNTNLTEPTKNAEPHKFGFVDVQKISNLQS